MTRPLAGLGVLLTRPLAQAGPVRDRLQAAGASVHCLPVLHLFAYEGPGLDAALSEYSQANLAVFVSANAVQFGLAALSARGIVLSVGPRLAAVGQATARALEDAGGANVLFAGAGSDSEALLALPQLEAVRGQTVLLFRGDSEGGGRTLLRDTLGQRGARVLEATCYRRETTQADPLLLQTIQAHLRSGAIRAVQVMSSESLAALIDQVSVDLLQHTTLLVPHPRIAEAAQARGLTRTEVTGFGEEAFLASLTHLAT